MPPSIGDATCAHKRRPCAPGPSGVLEELVPSPQVLNRYAYARDNALRYTDGRRSEVCCRRRRHRVAGSGTARAGKGSARGGRVTRRGTKGEARFGSSLAGSEDGGRVTWHSG